MKWMKSVKAVSLLLAASVALLVSCEQLDLFALARGVPLINGKTWNDVEMVFDVGGATYDASLSSPCVIKDGNRYKMWLSGESSGDGAYRVHYTESSDGKSWGSATVAVDLDSEGTNDTKGTGRPFVMVESGTYKMWYEGIDDSDARRILYTESSDGKTWTGHRLAIDIGRVGSYDSDGVFGPAVIKDGGLYRMWYVGNDGSTRRMLYAESSDGVTWTGNRLALDVGSQGAYDEQSVGQPTVVKDNLLYRMWYDGTESGGTRRILYAESSDGISWSNFQLAVDINKEGFNDTMAVSAPTVISDLGVGKMWYAGLDGSFDRRIMYAESR